MLIKSILLAGMIGLASQFAMAKKITPSEDLACQKKQAFFNFHQSFHESIENFVSSIFAEPSQLIVFGEEHSIHDEEFWSYITPFLLSQNNNVNCIFIETGADSEAEKVLKKFQNGEVSDLMPFNSTRLLMRWDNSVESLAQFIKNLNKNGIRLISVDDDSKQGGTFLKNLNDRDISMAQNILSAYSSGQCTRGIYAVGLMHMLRTDSGRGRVTMTNHLEKAGLNVKLTYLAVAGQLDVYDKDGPAFPNQGKLGSEFIWQKEQNSIDKIDLLCRENPIIPDKPFGFIVDKKIAPNSPLSYFPLIENCILGPGNCLESTRHDFFFGNYKDFDFIWVHRCMGNSSCIKSNDNINNLIRSSSVEVYN